MSSRLLEQDRRGHGHVSRRAGFLTPPGPACFRLERSYGLLGPDDELFFFSARRENDRRTVGEGIIECPPRFLPGILVPCDDACVGLDADVEYEQVVFDQR